MLKTNRDSAFRLLCPKSISSDGRWVTETQAGAALKSGLQQNQLWHLKPNNIFLKNLTQFSHFQQIFWTVACCRNFKPSEATAWNKAALRIQGSVICANSTTEPELCSPLRVFNFTRLFNTCCWFVAAHQCLMNPAAVHNWISSQLQPAPAVLQAAQMTDDDILPPPLKVELH